jgi:hypothetical protein
VGKQRLLLGLRRLRDERKRALNASMCLSSFRRNSVSRRAVIFWERRTLHPHKGEGDPHDEIVSLEGQIEELSAKIENCRKFILASRIATLGGGIALGAMLLGAIRFDPGAMESAAPWGGAYVAEMDGNLTAIRNETTTTVHWHGTSFHLVVDHRATQARNFGGVLDRTRQPFAERDALRPPG